MMMFWLKAAGFSLITVGFFLNGITDSAKYRMRVAELENSLSVIAEISGKMKAALPPPDELLSGLCREEIKLPEYIFTANELLAKYDFSDAWKTALLNCESPLNKNDRLLLARLGDIVGKSDIDTQLMQIELLSERIKNNIADARAEANEKCRLSQTLWAAAGVAAAIMLI